MSLGARVSTAQVSTLLPFSIFSSKRGGGGGQCDGFIQDGMYWRVAGWDASWSVAKQSFDLDMPPFLSLTHSERYRLLTLLVTLCIEPLTPIDQPLDKLEDLTPREVSNASQKMVLTQVCTGIIDSVTN
jgi:hypothetical protein